MAVLTVQERQALLSKSRYSKQSKTRATITHKSRKPTTVKTPSHSISQTDAIEDAINREIGDKTKLSIEQYRSAINSLEKLAQNLHSIERKRLDKDPVKRQKFLEHYEQVCYFEWLSTNLPEIYEVSNSVPNGSKRVGMDGFTLNSEGLKSGWPDVQIMIPSGSKCGLFIELKRPPNEYSYKSSAKAAAKPHQKDMLRKLITRGYQAAFAYGCDEAIKITEQYLSDGNLPTSLFLNNDEWI